MDYEDLYDKATNTKEDNVIFLVYDKKDLIGITGVDVNSGCKNEKGVKDAEKVKQFVFNAKNI